MLNISFFIAAFSSISWIIYCLKHLRPETTVLAAEAEILYKSTTSVMLPLAVLWAIFALILIFLRQKENNSQIIHLLDQQKKTAETLNALACSLLNSELETKNNVILHEFKTLVADINEILSEIIKRSNSISSAQIEHLWSRTAGGERWIIAKTFIETNNFQPDFANHLLQKAKKDPLLKESIFEFCIRYKNLRTLLETSERQKNLLNMIEYGAFGKVSHILLPLSKQLDNENDMPAPAPSRPKKALQPEEFSLVEEPVAFPSFLKRPTPQPAPSSKELHSSDVENGLKAIRSELLSEKKAPQIEVPQPAPSVSPDFSNTKTALSNLKKPSQPAEKKKKPVISLDELEKEIEASPDNNYDEYAYPFGAWLNDKNK